MTNLSATEFQYFQPSDHVEKNAYSSLLHILAQALLLISLILPSSISTPLRRLLFFPITGILFYLTFFTTTGGITGDTVLGPVLVAQAAGVLNLVLLHDPRKEFVRERNTNGEKITSSSGGVPGETLKERLVWGLSLLVNIRGYGWSFEPSPGILPPRPSTEVTHSNFIRLQMKKIVLDGVIGATSHAINTINPTFHLVNGIQGSNVSLGWRMLAILGFGSLAYARVCIPYRLCSLATVVTGILKPQAWPDLFGKFDDLWSVGRFWGRFWHQQMRVLLWSFGNALLPPRLRAKIPPMIRAPICLFVSFLISGIIHSAGEYMLVNHFPLDPFLFFAFQPFAIIFERVVLFRCFREPKNPTAAEKVLGYGFVLMWFTWTGPLVINPKIKAGAL